jgi:3-oxoadipate enol-lactonase
MPFANAPGATIHYTVSGAGRDAILLIMGLGGHASEWGEPFISGLAAQYRVIAMDNRGIDDSQTAATAWTMRDMAEDARAVLDAEGLQRAHIAGTSMGGMIAQTLALEFPERVGRLILMATSFGGRESLPPLPAAASVLLPAPGLSVAELQRRALGVLTGPGFAQARAELIAELAVLREKSPTRGRVFKAQFAAIAESDRSQRVRDLVMPTLVLHGSEDPLIPVENGKQLASRIPDAKLLVLDGCGHFPHVEQPDVTVRAILEFLEG